VITCPICEASYETDEIAETDTGTYLAHGPERYPRCDACDTQFEVAPVRIEQASDA
jgi:hypothetical protein